MLKFSKIFLKSDVTDQYLPFGKMITVKLIHDPISLSRLK